jgi:hypothetical protein
MWAMILLQASRALVQTHSYLRPYDGLAVMLKGVAVIPASAPLA